MLFFVVVVRDHLARSNVFITILNDRAISPGHVQVKHMTFIVYGVVPPPPPPNTDICVDAIWRLQLS